MSTQPVTYYCSLEYCQFPFSWGGNAVFIKNRFTTSEARKIAALDKEIEDGVTIFRRATPEEAEGAINESDVMGSLIAKIRAEERAKLIAAAHLGDLGNTPANHPLGAAGTETIPQPSDSNSPSASAEAPAVTSASASQVSKLAKMLK
jgi:hypothetical protein